MSEPSTPIPPPPQKPPTPPDGAAAFALAAVATVLGAGLGGVIGRLVWSPLPPGKRTEWSGMGDSVRKFGHIVGGLFFGGLGGLLVGGVLAARLARGKKPSPPAASSDDSKKTSVTATIAAGTNSPKIGNPIAPALPTPNTAAKPPDGAGAFALAAVATVLGAGFGGVFGRLVWSPLPPGKRTEWSGMGDSVRKFGHIVGGLLFGGVAGLIVGMVIFVRLMRGKKSPPPVPPALPDNQKMK